MDWTGIKVKDLIKALEQFNPEGEITLRLCHDKVDTWCTDAFELDLYNYTYEDEDTGEEAESIDVVLDLNVR